MAGRRFFSTNVKNGLEKLLELVALKRQHVAVLQEQVHREREITDRLREQVHRKREISDREREIFEEQVQREREISDREREIFEEQVEREREISEIFKEQGEREREISEIFKEQVQRDKEIIDLGLEKVEMSVNMKRESELLMLHRQSLNIRGALEIAAGRLKLRCYVSGTANVLAMLTTDPGWIKDATQETNQNDQANLKDVEKCQKNLHHLLSKDKLENSGVVLSSIVSIQRVAVRVTLRLAHVYFVE